MIVLEGISAPSNSPCFRSSSSAILYDRAPTPCLWTLSTVHNFSEPLLPYSQGFTEYSRLEFVASSSLTLSLRAFILAEDELAMEEKIDSKAERRERIEFMSSMDRN